MACTWVRQAEFGQQGMQQSLTEYRVSEFPACAQTLQRGPYIAVLDSFNLRAIQHAGQADDEGGFIRCMPVGKGRSQQQGIIRAVLQGSQGVAVG